MPKRDPRVPAQVSSASSISVPDLIPRPRCLQRSAHLRLYLVLPDSPLFTRAALYPEHRQTDSQTNDDDTTQIMDHVDNKRMRKRLAFDIHHRRAPPVASLIAPGVTPGTDLETGSPSTARVPTTAPVAPTTTRAPSTPAAAAPTTTPAQDTRKDKDKDDGNDVPTTTTPTTRVAATTRVATTTAPTTTVARTTTTVPTTPPVAATTQVRVNSVAAVDTSTSEFKQFTVTRTTKTASSSASALPSASAPADDGPSIGSIAGYAGAALAGIAVISMFAIWFIRRRRRREEDADIDVAPFNRQSWLRHSTMIHDDAPTPATTNFPPPRRDPDMIDRSANATPVTNYAGMNHYPQNNFGYATQPSYQPGAVIFSPSSANTSFGPGAGPATPLPYSPGYDPATPNPFEQQAGYTEVTRGGPPSPFNPYHHHQQFDEIQRQMTPSAPNANFPAPAEDHSFYPRAPSPRIEAAPPVLPPVPAGPADTFTRVPTYPELSPAPTSAHGHVVEVRASTYEGQATPVQYGFAEAPQSPVTLSAPMSSQPFAVPQPAGGRTLTRPETVYDTEDAYGGI